MTNKAADYLQALELELLSEATRKDAARLSSLFAEDFREFGSSGRVYRKEDVIAALQEEAPATFTLRNFGMTLLADGVALVTYESEKLHPDALPSRALRSSIWVREGDAWRMIFHQGTKR